MKFGSPNIFRLRDVQSRICKKKKSQEYKSDFGSISVPQFRNALQNFVFVVKFSYYFIIIINKLMIISLSLKIM